ncbi:hypothetical protein BDZ85DRAFT_85746 [Elsinoe ampelina]|uniref:Nucleolar 27S pre-rRNA processing Urb2/Npa2 C-terminal domain-containing protein n=1 Tax=Elsinoe ampelina TaxID=302913 RepID=A0A6A6GH27_9PEZI|nr:hypothetical protein BDZ85DRAFT_85746 [Elsinoe ampelina]
MPDTRQPSLPRLLTLDKTFETLEDRIEEVSRILELQLDDISKIRSTPSSNHGREDWTFRWISGHLKSGQSARLSARSWRLVRCLLLTVPRGVATRWLATSGLAQVILQALQDGNPVDVLTSAPPGSTNGLQSETPDASDTSYSALKLSKKRKRGDRANAEALPRPIGTKEHVLEICELLIEILKATDQSSDSSTAGLAAKLFGTMSANEAAQFLKWWARNATSCLDSVACSDQGRVYRIIAETFSCLSRTLRRRKHAFVADQWRLNLAGEALLPMLVLCQRVPHPTSNGTGTVDGFGSRQIRSFLVDELLRPLRDDAIASKTPGKTPSLETRGNVDKWMDGLLDEAAATLAGATPSTLGQAQRTIGTAFQFLLEWSMGLMYAAGLVQKREQIRWAESIFAGLSSIQGRVELRGGRNVVEVCKPILQALLMPFQRRQDFVRSSGVKAVLDEYGGLVSQNGQSSDATPDFDLIATVVAADRHVFDVASTTNETRSLLQALDRHYKDLDETRQVKCVVDILVPIINAHRQSRAAPRLLDLIIETLQQSQAGKQSPWVNAAFKQALGDLVTSSVDVTHIRNLLVTASLPLKTLPENEGDHHFTKTLPALSTFVQVIRGDDQIDQLRSEFATIVSLLDGVAKSRSSLKSVVKDDAFWTLLHDLNACLAPSPGHDATGLLEAQSECRSVAKGLEKKLVKEKLSDETAEVVTNYSFQVCELEACLPTSKASASITTPAFLQDNAIKRYTLAIARSLVTHPSIWLSVDSTIHRLILQTLSGGKIPEHNKVYLQLYKILSQTADRDSHGVLVDLVDGDNRDLKFDVLANTVSNDHLDKSTKAKIQVFLEGQAAQQGSNISDLQNTSQRRDALRLLALLRKYAPASSMLEQIHAAGSTGSENSAAIQTAPALAALTSVGYDPDEMLKLLLAKSTVFEQDIDAATHEKLLVRLSEVVESWSGVEKVQFAHSALDGVDEEPRVNLLIGVDVVLAKLQKSELDEEMVSSEARRLVMRMAQALQTCSDIRVCHALLRTIAGCLKDKVCRRLIVFL